MTGKTSLFTILTGVHQETRLGSTAVRTGVAKVPDPRLDELARIFEPPKITHATVEYLDMPSISKENLRDPAYVASLNKLGSELRDSLEDAQLPLTWDELETILCNFNSLSKGRYYVGHDIDEQLEHLNRVPPGLRAGVWYIARQNVLDPRLLGELQGWEGIRKPLCRVYRDERRIYCDLAVG